MKDKTSETKIPRKILMVTHYFAEHGGGIEIAAGRLAQEISTLGGYKVTWAASGLEKLPSKSEIDFLPMSTMNLLERAIGVPWPVWGIGSILKLRSAIKSSDIVWLHDTLYLGNILAFLWAKRSKKPVIITQHIGAIPYRNLLLRKLMSMADRMISVPMLKKADQTIFISDFVAEGYYNKTKFAKPVKIIPNGVDYREFHLPPREKRKFFREKFSLKASQPVLLFVGRFVERKGLKAIRHMAEIMPEYRFWLAGKGPIDPTRWLLPNVHVFRDRRGSSLAELYQSADLLILPSYGEGFPLVIQEAMSCGLPVMCSPQTAAGSFFAKPLINLAEVWPENPKRTAEEWARKIKNLPFILPLKENISLLSDFAQANWNWTLIAKAYSDVFEQICEEIKKP